MDRLQTVTSMLNQCGVTIGEHDKISVSGGDVSYTMSILNPAFKDAFRIVPRDYENDTSVIKQKHYYYSLATRNWLFSVTDKTP